MLAIVQEMRKQREQDAKERAEQLQSLKEEKSVFTYSLRDDLPVLNLAVVIWTWTSISRRFRTSAWS